MSPHRVGTREQWTLAREKLLEREAELAELSRALTKQRRELPWVAVEREYTFDTNEGQRSLAELFDGRSQLLIYHLMFGPSYAGACPGCSNLADHFDGGVVHLNHRDVTLLCVSRAPLEKLRAYKLRMGWQFPWVSSFESEFNFDFGFGFSEAQIARGELKKAVEEAPDWLEDWAVDVGTDLKSGLIEGPGWNAFALSDGVVYHTYSRHAPDGDMLAPYYYQLLDQAPDGRRDEMHVRRRDEYEDTTAGAAG